MIDRLRAAIEGVLRGMLPTLPNYLRWRYRVVAVTPGSPVMVSGVPISPTCPHGNLANISLRPGPDGAYAVPVVGSQVIVEFLEGNPELPEVCGLDQKIAPTLTTLGGGSTPVARVGDTVTITALEISAATMVAGGNPVTISAPLQCKITTGSAKVLTS